MIFIPAKDVDNHSTMLHINHIEEICETHILQGPNSYKVHFLSGRSGDYRIDPKVLAQYELTK